MSEYAAAINQPTLTERADVPTLFDHVPSLARAFPNTDNALAELAPLIISYLDPEDSLSNTPAGLERRVERLNALRRLIVDHSPFGGEPVDLVEWVPAAVKQPDGTWSTLDRPIIVCKAYAYRTPDDPRPGIGHAQEAIPGKTPYTKDSELMNAETSAWGRAIIAVLAADTRKGVASRDEVQSRRGA